jgi:hypothetical protein
VRGRMAVRWVKVTLCLELGGAYPNPELIPRGPSGELGGHYMAPVARGGLQET